MSEQQSSCASASEKSGTVEYRDVAGYEGLYQVGIDGNVRSVDRIMPTKRWGFQKFHGRVLKPSVHKDGYRCVNLQRSGRIKGVLVHRLVAAAFIGPIPDELEVNHRDGDKANNALSNLEIITPSENIKHAIATGLRPIKLGDATPNAKLGREDVIKIAELLRQDIPQVRIASMYGVNFSTISCIARGKTWSHLTGFSQGVKCSS